MAAESDPPSRGRRSSRTAPREVSDWILTWSRGTRRAPSDPVIDPDASLWRPRPHTFGSLLHLVEAHRLRPILDGSNLRMVKTRDGMQPALMHRHWVGLMGRLVGATCAFIAAVTIDPVYLCLIVLAASHGVQIAVRTNTKSTAGGVVAGTELILGILIGQSLGLGALRFTLVVAVVAMMVLTVVAWQVDMELITDSGRLVRTRGLLLMKRTVAAPLSSIRIADITGPFFGLGLVTVDTTSDRDRLLHNFGLVSQPNEWAALLLREAGRSKEKT